MHERYEAVIGLEVHAALKTKTKIFCSCSTAFGAAPNTHCCPICMGHPGVLPMLNRHALELTVRAGLALECRIADTFFADRKQYFYPDLPKAYQISQDATPLCRDGRLQIKLQGGTRSIGIARIHLEEDAGKLMHTEHGTLLDCNRCGIPLIEIVSTPVLHSGAEAAAYLRALRGVLIACDISDCRMQMGELRCDVNVSIRQEGCDRLGTRCEIKNLNSFAFVEKAIDYEIRRQCELLEAGQPLRTETRRYNEVTGQTELLRIKERAIDYRYMPEPDLPPVQIDRATVEAIAASLPELPAERETRLKEAYALSEEDAELLVSDPSLADFFEAAAQRTQATHVLTGLLLNELLRLYPEIPFAPPILTPARLGALATLVGEGTVNQTTAKKLLGRLCAEDFDPAEAVRREGLEQIRDEAVLSELVARVMRENPRAVADYRGGKKNALRALQGKVMAMTAGLAEPILSERLLRLALDAEE